MAGAAFSPWACECGAARCATEVVEVKNVCPYQMGCVPTTQIQRNGARSRSLASLYTMNACAAGDVRGAVWSQMLLP